MSVYYTKYLILGAGCSGLAFANHLKGSEYIIMEKNNTGGGYCRTFKKSNYIWDFAGHFFHFATPYWKNFFKSRIDENEFVTVKKNTKIYYKSLLIDYPFQKNIHQLPKEELIDCLYDLCNRESVFNEKTFEGMLYKKFGRSISDKFLIPYNEKLYACNLNNLDANSMGRFFPYADITEIISNMKKPANNSYNDFFMYPKNGAEVFVQALMKDLSRKKLFFNQECRKIDLRKKVVYSENLEIHYKKLINTIPLKYFIDLFDNDYVSKDLSCNKVLVLNMGFDKKSDFKDIHWMYFPDKDINFYRIGFYDNILNQPHLSLYVEIGYKEDATIDVEYQINLTLKNLKKVGIIDEDFHLMEFKACIMRPAYVHISEQSRNMVNDIKTFLAEQNVYTIGRYGGWKYCSIEDCLIEAKNLYDRMCN